MAYRDIVKRSCPNRQGSQGTWVLRDVTRLKICYEMVRQFLNFWGIFDHFDCSEQYQTSFLDVRLLSNDQFPRGSLYNNYFFFKLLQICKGSEGAALVIVIQFQLLDNHGVCDAGYLYIPFVYFKTG